MMMAGEVLPVTPSTKTWIMMDCKSCVRIVRYCLSEHFAVDPDRFMDCKPNSRPVRAWRQGVLQRGIHFEAEMLLCAEDIFRWGVMMLALCGRYCHMRSLRRQICYMETYLAEGFGFKVVSYDD